MGEGIGLGAGRGGEGEGIGLRAGRGGDACWRMVGDGETEKEEADLRWAVGERKF